MFTTLAVIYGEVLAKNVRCAFVLPESIADVLLAEKHMSEDGGNFPIFYRLHERIGKRLFVAWHQGNHPFCSLTPEAQLPCTFRCTPPR